MMKWGRKKRSSTSSTSSSSSHSHLISHVFPLSWLSKFKLGNAKPGSKIAISNQKEVIKNKENVQRVSLRSSPRQANYSRDSSKFYTQDNDGFWRLSFGEDSKEGDNKFAIPQPYWGSCKSNVKEVAIETRRKHKLNRTHGVIEPRDGGQRGVIELEKEKVSKEAAKDEILQRTYRRIVEATEELHKELDEVNGYRKSVEKEMSEFELLKVMQRVERPEQTPPCATVRKHQCVSTRDFDADAKLQWQQLKDEKIKEVIRKNEKQRKSFHISRESQVKGVINKQTKVRIRSPRTPSKSETCKIKALEDLKKAKLRKKIKEIQLEDQASALGSFAVVKCSRDPQQDFKDSMVEMILEKRIRRPEELEELLACYLTLNADEYHDLIIKVFRQVWCELKDSYFKFEMS